MKKTKISKQKKARWERVLFFIWQLVVLPLNREQYYESLSHYLGFSMALGGLFSFFRIISSGWLFFHSYGAFVDASYVADVSRFIVYATQVTFCVVFLFKGSQSVLATLQKF
jgi:hypothetical protein